MLQNYEISGKNEYLCEENLRKIMDKAKNTVRITAIRQTVYHDLMAKYENPIEHTCDVSPGQQWMSVGLVFNARVCRVAGQGRG